MRKRLFAVFLVIFGLCIMGTGCGNNEKEATTETTAATEEKTKKEENVKTATLFIGKKGDYGRYYYNYKGTLTPRKLMKGIEKTTGWNLTLNKRVTKRADGYIICFSKKSVLYTGQKNKESDEFYIPYKEYFYQSVLDSIRQTIRYNLKKDGETMNIYYWGKEDTPLNISELHLTIPMNQPYKGLGDFKSTQVKKTDTSVIYDVEGVFLGMKDEETVRMKVRGEEQSYRVTYPKLLPIFKAGNSGQTMKIQITENMATGEKLVTKIY